MLEAFRRAMSGASRRRLFFHIAVVLVTVSLFWGNNWKVIAAKFAFVAIGFLCVFLFELHKGWRVVAGKRQLGSSQLWRRFFIVVWVVSAIYIGLALYIAVFANEPDGLVFLFPFYFCFLFSCALPFFWEFRDLRTIEGEGDSN
jgi:hypothetical protein